MPLNAASRTGAAALLAVVWYRATTSASAPMTTNANARPLTRRALTIRGSTHVSGPCATSSSSPGPAGIAAEMTVVSAELPCATIRWVSRWRHRMSYAAGPAGRTITWSVDGQGWPASNTIRSPWRTAICGTTRDPSMSKRSAASDAGAASVRALRYKRVVVTLAMSRVIEIANTTLAMINTRSASRLRRRMVRCRRTWQRACQHNAIV